MAFELTPRQMRTVAAAATTVAAVVIDVVLDTWGVGELLRLAPGAQEDSGDFLTAAGCAAGPW